MGTRAGRKARGRAMKDGLPPIPKLLLDEAEADLTPPEVVKAWRSYLAWHTKALGPQTPYRMSDWQRQIEFTLRDRNVSQELVKLDAKAMSQDDIAAELAEQEYAQRAVTFSGSVERLKANR